MKTLKTCDSCGVEWVHKTGVDIKDHWHEYFMPDTNSIMFCEQCHADGKADEIAMENFERALKENDSGHQPS